jgi:hypothetical protein
METPMTHNLTRVVIATALVAALATPAFSQGRQASDPSFQAYAQQSSKAKKTKKSAKQRPVERYVARQQYAARPCAYRSWVGCHGWDPDPNVRSMIRMDANLYDD